MIKSDKIQRYLKQHGSTILSCVAAVGVIATTVIAIKNTHDAIDILEKAKREKNETSESEQRLNTTEKVKTTWKCYIPTILIGSSTIICIMGANTLNKHQQAALVSAYTMLSNYHKEYKDKLIDIYGVEADEKIKAEMARSRCDWHQWGIDTPDEKVIFYDVISKNYVKCYEREIMDAEYHLKRNFTLRGYATLNEFYDFVGLPRTDEGDEIGWSTSQGIGWVDFEHHFVENIDNEKFDEPCYIIDFVLSPDILNYDYC